MKQKQYTIYKKKIILQSSKENKMNVEETLVKREKNNNITLF